MLDSCCGVARDELHARAKPQRFPHAVKIFAVQNKKFASLVGADVT